MDFDDYVKYDATGLAELIEKGDMSADEVAAAAIDRIEALNPSVNAVVFKAYDEAKRRASRHPRGKFGGVPILLKDALGFKEGWPTRSGSALVPDHPSARTSYFVSDLERAGMIALGKTSTAEFGLLPTTEPRLYGPTRNPWNLARSAGGSSGGAAAAVAGGMVPIAHGNDAGGSIRIPAACCGLVGLKPSRGRTSLGPDVGDVMGGLVVEHVITRSVRDTAAVLDLVAGARPGDPYGVAPPPAPYLRMIEAAPRRLRIGFATKAPDGSSLAPECEGAVARAAKLCVELGHTVEEASPPINLASFWQAFFDIFASGLAASVNRLCEPTGRPPNLESLEGLTLGLYEYGRSVPASVYIRSWSYLHSISRQIALWHEEFDVWLTPTLRAAPLPLGQIDTSDTDPRRGFAQVIDFLPFTPIQNATGQPAISLPLHRSVEGLPIGVQFVGQTGEEGLLLSLSAELERAHPWPGISPFHLT